MKSYSLSLKDSQGRTLDLFINGDSIQELIDDGYPESEAVEMVQNNSFEVAVRDGDIGADVHIA